MISKDTAKLEKAQVRLIDVVAQAAFSHKIQTLASSLQLGLLMQSSALANVSSWRVFG